MTTAEALAVVREALGLPFIAAGGTELHGRAFAALALIKERMEELERKERVNSGLTRNLSVVQAELEKAEAERDESMARFEKLAVNMAEEIAKRERRVAELEAALEGMESMREVAERERDELKQRATENWDSYENANRRIEELEAALRDYEEHGCRCDLNPTRMVYAMHADNEAWVKNDGWWQTYLRRVDEGVRSRARRALERK